MAVHDRVLRPDSERTTVATTKCTKGGCKLDGGRRMPGAGLSRRSPRKAPLGQSAFQPYWGKLAVRNDRGGSRKRRHHSKPDPRLDPTRPQETSASIWREWVSPYRLIVRADRVSPSERGPGMRRREFIGLVGSAAAAWPFAVRAQQPAMPVIGFLTNSSFERSRDNLAAFHQGLAKTGNIEGRNFAIEYHWTDGQTEPLPALAAELVGRRVAVIVTVNTPPTLAAKAATQTIPIIFNIGTDPVELGLVQSLARPGGNITGAAALSTSLSEKRLELLHELLPAAKSIGFLVNPTSAVTKGEMNAAQGAARALGVQLLIVEASSVRDFDGAFKALATADAVLTSGDALFLGSEIVAWANRGAIPAIYLYRYSVAAGGLMSYGTKPQDTWRLIGEYAGRILNGERPSDLPVQQTTHFYLVINLRTAKALGLTIPATLLARADEVIE
jgi:putative tryptophan/tyrosine transport system substrate-binding protein